MSIRFWFREPSFLSKMDIEDDYVPFIRRLDLKIEKSILEMNNIFMGVSTDILVQKGSIIDWDVKKEEIVDKLKRLDVMNFYIEEVNVISNPFLKTFLAKCSAFNIQKMEILLRNAIVSHLKKSNKQQITQIKEDIETKNVVDFTEGGILQDKIKLFLKKGGKHIANLHRTLDQRKLTIKNGLGSVISTIYGVDVSNKSSFNQQLVDIMRRPTLCEQDVDFLSKILVNTDEQLNIMEKPDGGTSKSGFRGMLAKELQESNLIVLESDKSLGFVILTVDQVLELYRRTNVVEGMHRFETTLADYNSTVLDEISEIQNNVTPWILDNISTKVLRDLQHVTPGDIGKLRLLPKIQKLQDPGPHNFHLLKARTLKCAVSDPVSPAAKMLAEITKLLAGGVDGYMKKVFGATTTVKGCKESFFLQNKRVNRKMVAGQYYLSAEADIETMYPSCKYSFVVIAYKDAMRICDIDGPTQQIVLNLIYVVMKNNVVEQADGFYRTFTLENGHMEIGGWAIGCHAAAEGSNLVILIEELKLFIKLKANSRLDVVLQILRFRDDNKYKLLGTLPELLAVLQEILTGYPTCFSIIMKISYIRAVFLDIESITMPGQRVDLLTLYRKPGNSYGIIQKDSNNPEVHKKAAMYSALYRMRFRTNSRHNYKHQRLCNIQIFRLKGYEDDVFDSMLRRFQKTKLLTVKKKKHYLGKYSGKIVFDQTNDCNRIILDLLCASGFQKLGKSAPALVPGRKALQVVFTKKELYRKLRRQKLP